MVIAVAGSPRERSGNTAHRPKARRDATHSSGFNTNGTNKIRDFNADRLEHEMSATSFGGSKIRIDQVPGGTFCGGDEIPAGTFHGGDEVPAGTFHGGDEIPAGTFHAR